MHGACISNYDNNINYCGKIPTCLILKNDDSDCN